jgi:hypothetical protein
LPLVWFPYQGKANFRPSLASCEIWQMPFGLAFSQGHLAVDLPGFSRREKMPKKG